MPTTGYLPAAIEEPIDQVAPMIGGSIAAVTGRDANVLNGIPGYACDLRTVVFPRRGGGSIRINFLRISRDDDGREAFHFPLGIELREV